jgi:hypothetical protein
MAVFLLGLVRALEQYPKPTPSTLLILGLGFGCSIGSRILAGFGVLETIGALALLFAIEARTEGARTAGARLGRFALTLIPCAILAYGVMALLWPWSVAEPLNPFRAVVYFSRFFEKPWQELFEGALIAPPDMPRSYVPVLMGLKLPIVFLALSFAGLGGASIASARGGIAPRRRAILLGVVLAAILPVAATVIERPAMYNGVRHFLFVLPPLAVLGGLAGIWIALRMARFGRAAMSALVIIFAAGIALPVAGMARLHPYEYVYFNPIAGGVQSAQHRFMLDYWGLAFKQAGNALRDQLAARGETPPAGRKWTIAVCGPHPPAQVALGDRFTPTWDPKGADFALTLGAFYCARLDAPVLLEVVRDGVVFARAYDLRGRNVTTLFTRPPVTRD